MVIESMQETINCLSKDSATRMTIEMTVTSGQPISRHTLTIQVLTRMISILGKTQ